MTLKTSREFAVSNAIGRIALGEDDRIYLVTSSGWPEYKDGIAVLSLFDSTFIPNWKAGSGFYGIGYDKECKEIYVANAKGFQGNGEVSIYRKDGALVKTIEVGRGPAGFLVR